MRFRAFWVVPPLRDSIVLLHGREGRPGGEHRLRVGETWGPATRFFGSEAISVFLGRFRCF